MMPQRDFDLAPLGVAQLISDLTVSNDRRLSRSQHKMASGRSWPICAGP